MPCSDYSPGVEHLRLFFAEDQEETALALARLFLQHLGEADRFIHPDDLVEDLVGWRVRPDATIIAFLTAIEEEQVFPKEALNSVDTFRELVEYVAARSRPRRDSHAPQPNPPSAHNSFTIL
jgi:predicted Ser/Thr protein kinase